MTRPPVTVIISASLADELRQWAGDEKNHWPEQTTFQRDLSELLKALGSEDFDAKFQESESIICGICVSLEPIAPPDVVQAARDLLDYYDKPDCVEAVSCDFIDTLRGVIMLHGRIADGGAE